MPFLRRILVSSFLLAAAASAFSASPRSTPQIVAYIFPQNATLTSGEVDPHSVTRLNYAFANIQDGRMVTGFAHDAENFAFLTALRKENPNLTILVSVGGWLWSTNFSDVSLNSATRATFIHSVAEFITQYQLDGLDIDWEYPGLPGAGHPFRPEDKQNFTALLRELRQHFDRVSRETGRRLYLTIAAGASPEFLAHTDIDKVARIVDTVNLMSYDYYEPGSGPLTGHHAALFTNPADPEKTSADASVRAFEKAGVPAGKLVLGIPFYGHAWTDVPPTSNGLYQPGKPAPRTGAPFSQIETTMLGHGFTRYWDPTSQVPSLYNPETRTFVSYEDPESIAGKCKYVRAHKLGGIMIWDLESDDPARTLIKSVNAGLH
ncbi:MAG TPA: glycoside hydrolase family 18 protein [Terracidiphilus sp.]